MPSKNTIKRYVAGGVYHIYNRGVEKRNIFLDERDYSVFLHYIKSYLSLPETASGACPGGVARHPLKYNLHQRVLLLAYCLMPNHFHLMLRQEDETAMTEFMKHLSNAYVGYFNPRRSRVGPLYQGPYKAALINDDTHYPYLTRYIHRNPFESLGALGLGQLSEYPYSSYPDYLEMRHTSWLHPELILQYFPLDRRETPFGQYRSFVEETESDDQGVLAGKLLD